MRAEHHLANTHSTIKARLVCAYFGFVFNKKSIRQLPNEYSARELGCQAGLKHLALLCIFQLGVIWCIETKQVDEEEKIPFPRDVLVSPQIPMKFVLHSGRSKHPSGNAAEPGVWLHGCSPFPTLI